MIPTNKLGWMAGVVDLRGRIIRKANKQRATPQIVLMVESKEGFVIRELSSLTGTRPEFKKERVAPEWMRRNCQEHCPTPHVHVHAHNWKMPPIARWTITGAGVAVIVYNLLPFLMSDRQWAALMFETIGATPLVGQGSGATLATIQRLAELGWELPPQFEPVVRPALPAGTAAVIEGEVSDGSQ